MNSNPALFLSLAGSLLMIGCGASTDEEPAIREVPYHERVSWEASDYFNEAEVIAFCKAIEADDIAAMQEALDAGADINVVGKQGMTLLMWAFPDHKVERFRWLLEHGANPNICFQGDFGSRKTAFRKGKSVTYLAVETKWPEYLALVLKHEGDPNLQCQGQLNPLIHVAMNPMVPNKKNRITALLEAGADIDAINETGVTLAMNSAAIAYYDITLLLLKRGSDHEIYQDKFNRQLVHFVVGKESRMDFYSKENKKSYELVVQELKDRGVDFPQAQADILRWNSVAGSPTVKRRIREREVAERKRRDRLQQD